MSIEEKAERAATWLYSRMYERGEIDKKDPSSVGYLLYQYYLNLFDRIHR